MKLSDRWQAESFRSQLAAERLRSLMNGLEAALDRREEDGAGEALYYQVQGLVWDVAEEHVWFLRQQVARVIATRGGGDTW